MDSKGTPQCPFAHSGPDASPRSKSEILHAHFGGRDLPSDEKIVCPWGIEAALRNDIVYAQMSGNPDEWHGAMFQAIRDYRRNRKSTLVIIAPEDPPTHQDSRLLASQLFLELSAAFEHHQKNGEPLPAIKARYRAMYARLLANPSARLTAGAVRGREPQNVVAMGPLFERPHGRYAPHLCLVALRFEDIAAAGGGEQLTNLSALQARQRRERERLHALGAIRVIDEGGEIVILNNEFYPDFYLQISEERYRRRIQALMARPPREDLIEE